jgi:hypothetical protein
MVLEDDFQYVKGLINRNKILDGRWLTIPIKKFHTGDLIKDIKVSDDNWKIKHKNTLRQYPKKEINYEILEKFMEIYELKSDLLLDYNLFSIKFIKEILSIETKLILSSEIDYDRSLMDNDLLIDIVKRVGGTAYLSGKGAITKTNLGDAYIDEEKFKEIKLEILDYTPPNVFSALDYILRDL